MLRDRYAPMNLFDLVPALGMAHGPGADATRYAARQRHSVSDRKADLARRFPHTLSNRPALDPGRGHPAPAGGQASVWLEL